MATLYDYFDGETPAWLALSVNNANDWAGQTFTPSVSYTVSRVDVWTAKSVGANIGTVNVGIYAVDGSAHPTGAALAYGTVVDADVDEVASYKWVPCEFTNTAILDVGTQYAIVIHGVSLSAVNTLVLNYDGNVIYTGGELEWSTDGGSNWATQTNNDMLFRVYGSAVPIGDKTYSKKLVSIGNHEVWYQTAATTMSELAAATGDINTVNPLTAFMIFQKLFITNKTNLKVTDFANSKITTGTVGTHPPLKGTILTGGSSGAEMIVDYITATSGACTIYGYRTTSATFTDTETVTGTNPATAPSPYYSGGSGAISFVLTANEVAAPHWYDWTVYGADATNFGAMPGSAYISCRYRGRCVLAGNPDYPHQWYMSKVAHPWDFAYSTTDPLTAVAGNNADAGELGDIIRAMIPFGDDFLVFGCSNSIHILTGDPAFSGQIDEIDDTTGIFSPWSWCKDAKGNLYFWGTSGLYKMEGGRQKPVNISEGYLPKWVDDWALDPDLHRVVLKYDPLNHGIIISKTTLADGTNLNYFFDLKIEGFFPETYPEECAMFDAVYYDSDATATRTLVVGCFDGYLRKFDYTAKDDNVGATTEAIDAYVTLEMILANEADDSVGKLTSLTVVVGGGATGGDMSDSDAVSYDIHEANDAETCLEKIKDGDTPQITGTFTGPGRHRIRDRIRGRWLGIRFYNNTASETFALNSVSGKIVPAGKIK